MDPWFYFRAVVVIVLTGFVGLPFLADGVNAVKLQESSGGCRIVQVIDGDSIRLWCPGRGLQSARIRGFDAPEVFSPRCREELWRGTRAAWALRGMMMAADGLGVVRDGTDPDGQALVFMSLDGVPVARKMIGAGHARPYDGGHRASWCW